MVFRKVNFSEQTAAFGVYGINWLVSIAVVESVYNAVRTDCLYKADYFRSFEWLIKNYFILTFVCNIAGVWLNFSVKRIFC